MKQTKKTKTNLSRKLGNFVDKNISACVARTLKNMFACTKKSHFTSILYRVIKKLRQDASNRCAADVQKEALCLKHLAPVLGVEEVWLVEVGLFSTNL